MKLPFPKLALTAMAALQCAGFAFAGGEGWISDYEAAKKQAAAEKKDLLIDFTGSDWCGWCIKLDKEVFSHEPFKAGVKDTFVLVSLDYPRKPENIEKLGATLKAQNQDLQKKYAIRGFPTILLCDANGAPYASTGYAAGGPEKYVESLNELRAKKDVRDKAFAEADKATGVDKAKQLVAALKAMELDDATVESFYATTVAQIKAADPKDETGFGKEAAAKGKMTSFKNEVNQLGAQKDLDGIITLVDKTLADESISLEDKQQIAMTKANVYLQQGKFDEATKATDAAIAIAPDSKLAKPIEGFKSRITMMKEAAAKKAASKEEASTPKEKE